jgi:predicted TIM-barrel fold metal-dependent hydrolase
MDTSSFDAQEFDARPFDADNHYYEKLDSCTRYLDKKFTDRGVKAVQDGKRVKVLMANKVNSFIPNPTFDPIIVPGCLDPLFRGQIPEGVDPRSLMKVEPLGEHPEYQGREERLKVMDDQRLGSAILFPTFACGVEQGLKDDIPATMATLSAFNKWLEEDWGFAYENRLFGAAMISLADVDACVAEVESLLERGVRVIHVRPAPVPEAHGASRSLGNKQHDPVWARIAEAGVPVAFHLGDSGYEATFGSAWGSRGDFGFGKSDALGGVLSEGRAIHDTIASLVVHGVFTRHPTLKVASIENGSDWVSLLVKHLQKKANQAPWAFAEPPLDTLRRHVWTTPYLEEDLGALSELLGADKILFGSDWPHGEGVALPLDFEHELGKFDAATQQRIMRDNCLELLTA